VNPEASTAAEVLPLKLHVRERRRAVEASPMINDQRHHPVVYRPLRRGEQPHGDDPGIGSVLRKKLQLTPYKSHGVFVVPVPDDAALTRLYEKYGLNAPEGSDLDGLDADTPPAALRTAAEGKGGHRDVADIERCSTARLVCPSDRAAIWRRATGSTATLFRRRLVEYVPSASLRARPVDRSVTPIRCSYCSRSPDTQSPLRHACRIVISSPRRSDRTAVRP
jgi:hypothetical protein